MTLKKHDKFLTDIFTEGSSLPLIDQFYSLQGEGYHTGKAAYFVRVGGCDIGCQWCDEKITWSPSIHKAVSIKEIISKTSESGSNSLVMTGGEPCIYNLEPITILAHKNNIETYLETSGAYPITGKWDWICVSPKPQEGALKENLLKADELKIIIFDDDDIKWAEECAEKVAPNCRLYLQPEWSRHKEKIPQIVEYIKKNPKWKISIQAHKFMKIP